MTDDVIVPTTVDLQCSDNEWSYLPTIAQRILAVEVGYPGLTMTHEGPARHISEPGWEVFAIVGPRSLVIECCQQEWDITPDDLGRTAPDDPA